MSIEKYGSKTQAATQPKLRRTATYDFGFAKAAKRHPRDCWPMVPLGVADALLDPTLKLHDSNGSLISFNDNWRSDQEAATVEMTLTPTDNREAAIVATLLPRAYSGVIRGAGDTTGVALIEAFALNQ
jgi:hypothetical protein